MKKQIQNFTKLLMMLLGMAFFQQSVVGQVTINMGSGPTTTNSPTGTLFDDGGPAGVYMNNANYSLLISVPGADSISLTFSAFNTELDWDYFQIYQGNSAAGLHITNGSVPPASLGNNFAGFGPGIHGAPLTPFTYRVAGSEMFLRFRSDGSVNAAGWQATWAAKMRSAQNDAGVLRIDSPAFYQSGNRNIVATISNFGVNQITSATVNWSVNGLIQTPATFNGLLDTMNGSGNRTARVNLGSVNFINNTLYTIKAWTSFPNGIPDTVLTNDTATRIYRSPLNGNYTICQTGCDFSSITQAGGILSSSGVSGPVNFSLLDNLYNNITGEVFPITISNVTGLSAINRVTFRPANNVSPLITDSNGTALFIIENAKYITFDGRWNAPDDGRNLTIENRSLSANAAVFIFRNEAAANTIRNTVIRYAANNTSTNPTNGAITVLGTSNLIGVGNDSLTIFKNTFAPWNGNYYGTAIAYTGQSLTQQNDWGFIDSNWFYGYRIFGVFISGTNQGNGRQYSIRGNSFYDTITVAPHPVAYIGIHSEIYFNSSNAASWGHQINGNFIGGSQPLAQGLKQQVNPSTASIYNIWYNASNITPGANINQNRITNIAYNQGGVANFYYPYHLYINSGYVDILSNVIGHETDTALGIRYDNNSGVCMYAMYMFHSAPTRINYNTISGIVVNSNTAVGYIGIYHGTTTIGEAYVDSNIVRRFYSRSSQTSTTTCAAFGGIFVSNSSPTHFMRGNIIGGLNPADSISIFSSNVLTGLSSPANTRTYGIYNNAGISQIRNNLVSQIYTNGNASGTTTSASLVGIINASGTGGNVLSGNTVRDLYSRTVASTTTLGIASVSAAADITNNIVRNIFSESNNTATTTSAAISGILVSSSQQHQTLNNSVFNLNLPQLASTQLNGICASNSGVNLVRGNRVFDLISGTTNASTSTSSAIVGVNSVSGAMNQTVDSNFVYNLISTNNSATVNSTIAGVVFNGSATVAGNSSAVTRNRIWGLTHAYPLTQTPTTAIQYGIQYVNGTVTIANNLIRLGRDSAGALLLRPGQYRGIMLSTASTNQVRVYHNNVLMHYTPDYGTAGAPNPSTGCIELTTTSFSPGFVDIRNNIFVNNSVNGGTSTINHYNEMYPFGMNLITTNANILHNAGGLANILYRFNGTNYTTLNSFRSVSLQAVSSGYANPNFISPNGGSLSVNLGLSSPNPAEGAGDTTANSFVPVDADGRVRSSFGPTDIGAVAGNYTTSGDIIAPFIYYTPLTNTSSTAPRTFTATIYDGASVPVGTTISPRVYYKKTTQVTWASTAGVRISGSTRNNTFQFTIDHSLISGLNVGDVVQYYVIAADSAAGNVSSNPAFADATNTNTVTTHPTTPNSYLFNDPIPTTVFIGTGSGTPNYPTLTGTGGFFSAVANSALQGNTTVLIQSNVTEPGTFELNKWLEAGAGGYQMTIRPADNTQVVLSGSVANSNGLIRLNNADNVEFLGWSPTGTPADTNLVIRSSNTSTPAIGFSNGGSSDTLINVILESRVSSTGLGVVYIAPSSLTRGLSNTLISNCWIRHDLTGTSLPAIGIYGLGTSPRFNSDITITGNRIYNFTFSGVTLTSGTGNNINITNNHFFYNYGINTSTSMTVISMPPGVTSNNNNITGNFIGGSASFAQGAPWVNNTTVTFSGISVSTGTGLGTNINNNIIQNINLTSTTNTGTFTGIWPQGTAAVYNVNNNRIGSYSLPFYSLNNARFIGINTTTSGNVNILNDSILNITVLNAGTTAGITGIQSTGGSTNLVNINNNVVANLYTTSTNTGTTTAAAIIGIVSQHSTLTQNINNNRVRTLRADGNATTSIRGILVTSGTPNITNNIVFGLNSRTTYTGTLTLAAVIPIASTTTSIGTININDNNVDSIWITSATLSSTQMIGILYNSGGSQNASVSRNTVTNLNIQSNNVGLTTSSALVGIMINATATVNANYNDNRISVLNHFGAASVSIAGMYVGNSTSVNGNNSFVSRNLIHSLRSTSNISVTQTGLQVNNGFLNVTNNMIRVGIDSAGNAFTDAYTVRGIWHQNATQCFYYHNNILVGGAPISGSASTFGLEVAVSIIAGQQNDVRNNIIANIASNGGTANGFHFGVRYWDSLRVTSNYNIIHTPGVGGTAGGYGLTLARYTLLGGDSTSWKARTGLDIASSSVNPQFVAGATGPALGVSLNLSGSNPAERSGDASVNVATDFYNNLRSGLTPTDVGAHAGNFNLTPDAFPPVITYTPLTNAGSFIGTRQLNNVTITDNNGIVMSGADRPRIYYSKDRTTWYSSGAVSVSGSATNATANFIIDYLTISPPVNGTDSIYYFVVAQDAANNVQSFPTLAVGTDVNNITQRPATPSRYNFLPVIAPNTVIPVGLGQTFTSLTNTGGAFEFINSRTLGGNVTIEITSDITNETGAVLLNKFAEDGPGAGTFTLTIRPNASTTTPRLIQGSFQNTSSSFGLITLVGADRVKITGIPTGGNNTQRLLLIRNTATTNAYAAASGNGLIVVSSASGVAVTNCILESGNSNTAGGTIEFRVGLNNQFLTTPCSFDTVNNCIMRHNTIATLPDGIPANAGFYSFGNANVYNNNIVFTNNQVSNFVVAGAGVVGNNGDGFVISNNSFFYDLGFVPNITGLMQAIVFIPGSFSSGNNISNNFIGGSAPNCGGGAWTNPNNIGFYGIRTSVGNGANTIISNNTIQNLAFTNTAATQPFNGIRSEAGNTSITGNLVGHPTNTNSILWSTSGLCYGVYYFGLNNITIQNNAVQGINMNTLNVTPQFIGVYLQSGTVVGALSGNTVGHNTTANSIRIASNTTHFGMLLSSAANLTPAYTISNNLIANITCLSTGTGGLIYGAQMQNTAFPTITNNTVHNLRSASISTSTGGGVVTGLFIASSSATSTVTNNTIHSLFATNTGTAPTAVFGIYQSAGQDNIYRANRIFNLGNASTSTSVNPAPGTSGISIGGASNYAYLQNNQISLGSTESTNVQHRGIWLLTSTTAVTLKAVNNSVVIDGTSSAGIQNTYAFLRGNNTGTEINTNVELINNIFANRRSGGSGNHYAISNQASSPSYTTWNVPTSRYNLLVTANTNTVGEWGLGNNNITDWRANSTSDILSYYVQSGTGTGQLNLTNLFSSINQGTLNLQTTNAEVWYVYGKGITGSVIDNLNTDFSGVSRSTSQGIATTIGSAHMASAPSMLPVAAIASGAPAANTTTTYTFAGRPVATVNWGSSAPTSATVYDFTGVNPPASPAGNFNNRYVRIDVSGGTTPYSYGLTYNFNNANLGGMQNPNNMRLATSNQATPTSWAIQFTTIANGTNGTATVSGLSTTGNAITFTGTELNAPPSVLSFTPSSAAVGASVTIRGTLFTGASALSFNGVAQSTYTVVNDTTITTTVPFGATTGPVSVTNPFGTGTSLGNFTVIQPPTVTAFSPGSGTFGTAVTITGTNFSTATRVRFNTTLASFTIVNSTTITTTVPNGSSTGVISVINPADSAASSSTFTVFPVATISSFTPASGPVGTNVTIIGNNFNAITAVRFNGVNASFTVVSVTEISATVPNGSSTGAITVINGSGTGTSGTNFTVTTPPTVTSFTPSSGGVGSTVTIFGTNFTGTPTVTFNTTNATSVTVINSTQLTAVVPAGATSGLITVTTSQGSAVSAGAYTVFTDLIVNSNQFVFGTYNNITVTGTGIANLTGTLTALGNVTVQTGGRVVFGTEVINGLGNFTANSGSRLVVGSAEGINAFGTTGNLQINGTRTVNSGATVEFNNNTGNQNSGNLITNIDTLIVNTAGGDLILNTALTVNNRLVFTAGSVRLGPNNLTITNSSATLPGLNASSYIKTDGIGSVRRNVLNNTTNVLFPVGSLTLYSPAQLQLTNASTADIFSVRVFNSVLTGGTTGSAIATSMVNNTWVISENTVGGSNATLSVTWNNGQEVGGFNRAQCAIFTYNTGTSLWTRPGAYGAATGIDPYTRTVSGLTFFNAFTVGDNLATPLPVNLLTFKATAVDNDVVLNWITASEQNNKGFFVERSADGETFETVTFVGGRGNSTTNVKYLFTDEAAFDFAANNTLYYRLRQVDFDGTETISDVIAVTRSTDVVTYTNAYPNPFTTGLKLDIVSLKDSDYNMMIADMQGRVVLQKTISVSKGFNQIDLKEMDELKSGVYFINLNGADAIKVKVIKTN